MAAESEIDCVGVKRGERRKSIAEQSSLVIQPGH